MQGLPVAYKPMNASGVVKDRGGEFAGFICLTATGATLTVYDHNASASGNIVAGPITLAAGQLFEFNTPVAIARGIYIALTGAATLNVLYN